MRPGLCAASNFGIIYSMQILGEQIFAKAPDGSLASRIGTLFLKTPGLVTRRGVHAMQRVMWIDHLNAGRSEAGLPPLTSSEEEAELEQSVDLIFTDDFVLIRPDPDRMDLAFLADDELQKLVNKRRIRFLNTHAAKVRNALRARGENWRMARAPISQEDMSRIVEGSRVAIGEKAVYFYNQAIGTRYITAGGYDIVSALPADEYRAQVREVVSLLKKRNRMGHPEVDLFPTTTPIEIKNALKGIEVDSLDDAALRAAVEKIALDWRMSLPPELREESVGNFDWRNAMCAAVTAGTNETNAAEQDLIQGISPEFYRQIEWLPGARIDRGEVIFDPLWDEYSRTRDPSLEPLCDFHVRFDVHLSAIEQGKHLLVFLPFIAHLVGAKVFCQHLLLVQTGFSSHELIEHTGNFLFVIDSIHRWFLLFSLFISSFLARASKVDTDVCLIPRISAISLSSRCSSCLIVSTIREVLGKASI